jgi:DnaJ-class molecular chaperone
MRQAYRRLSVIFHPDKNKSPDAAERFRELAKAAEVLEDEKQRELYDYYLDHPRVSYLTRLSSH